MTLPTPHSLPETYVAYLATKAPSELHVAFAEYISVGTGEPVTARQVQLFLALHSKFQSSPEWKSTKKANASKRDAQRAAEKLERANKAAEKAEPVQEDQATVNASTGELETPYPNVQANEKGEGKHYVEVQLTLQADHGFEIHRAGCADLAKLEKRGTGYTVDDLWANSPEHAHEAVLSSVNWSDGTGHMGYTEEHVKIMSCAKQDRSAAPKPVARKAPVKKSATPKPAPVVPAAKATARRRAAVKKVPANA